jgi:hypothetical protein
MPLKLKMSRRKGDDMETAEPHFRGKCQNALKIIRYIDGRHRGRHERVYKKDVQLLH